MAREMNTVAFGRLKTRDWRWVIESDQEDAGMTLDFLVWLFEWMVIVFPGIGSSTRRNAALGIEERGKLTELTFSTY